MAPGELPFDFFHADQVNLKFSGIRKLVHNINGSCAVLPQTQNLLRHHNTNRGHPQQKTYRTIRNRPVFRRQGDESRMVIDNNTANSYNILNEGCSDCNALCCGETCACSDNHLLGYLATENEAQQTSCNLNSFTNVIPFSANMLNRAKNYPRENIPDTEPYIPPQLPFTNKKSETEAKVFE